MLTVQIYSDAALTQFMADFTNRVHPETGGGGLRFSTNGHGFAALDMPLIPMSLSEAFSVYAWPGTPHVIVSDQGAGVVWEGRLEDITIVDGGVALMAFGYQRAYYDVPYTALWSKSGSGGWRPVLDDELATAQTQQYETDNNNRIYIAPRKGEQIRTGNNDQGVMTFAVPHNSARTITNISFDYDIKLTSSWRVNVQTHDDNFANTYVDYTHTANGSNQTGTVTEALTTPNVRLTIAVQNNTGSTETIAGDTGDDYVRLTNIRIKTTTAATVLASDIVASIAAYVDAINTLQVYSGDDLIEATTTDLQDELYEDEYPAVIFDRLALLHGYEWGVWEGRRLHFRTRGSAGRQWAVDVTRILELQRSLENVRNSAYGVYRDADGRTMRTTATDDSDSQERYAVIRRGFIDVQTTSLSEAQTQRSAWLTGRADDALRASIEFERLYDITGAEYPLYMLRAGDTVTMRNLAPTLDGSVDQVRTFIVGETEYNAANNTIRISPAEPIPAIDVMIARREAGI